MTSCRSNSRGLAIALLSGEWTQKGLFDRACLVLDDPSTRQAAEKLAALVLERFGRETPPPTLRVLAEYIERTPLFEIDLDGDEYGFLRQLNLSLLPRPVMTPAPAIPAEWKIPPILTTGELAEWLEIPRRHLDWFADCHSLECSRQSEALRHYRYRWIGKRRGGKRLLEIPKSRLKKLQRTILREILDRIPPHDAAHAFRPGRSIATFAAPHCGQRVVLKIDLRDFFPSVNSAKVIALFRFVGYPEAVARLLCGLCSNTTPAEVVQEHSGELSAAQQSRVAWRYGVPHLPQGAPTSPALANLATYRLDVRLAALATKCNSNYTRYADDLVFSGDGELERCLPRFRVLVLAIVLDEGFAIQHRKTQVMRAGGRQQVAGILVNEHPNFPRRDFDRLRAILFNCARNGPHSQLQAAFDSSILSEQDVGSLQNHLHGKIAFFRMINPRKAERLQRLYEAVVWDE